MAKAFASQGANLVLLARRFNLLEENAKAITDEFGVEVLPFACDITDTEKVKAAVAATIEKFGRVDILVNNAGTGAVAPAEEITDDQFKHEMQIDLFGTFICAREFGKEMIKAGYGRIINIASMYGLVGLASIYSLIMTGEYLRSFMNFTGVILASSLGTIWTLFSFLS